MVNKSMYFPLAFVALLRVSREARATEWCKAAPENGKPDFGVCLPDGQGAAQYMVEVLPVVGSGVDLHADVSVRILGFDGIETAPIDVASEERGTEKRVVAERIDVGDPEEIKVSLSGQKTWRCQRITIWKDFRYWIFDCVGNLDAKSSTATYLLSGNKIYSVRVQTGDDEHAGTEGGIEMTLLGSQREASPKLLAQNIRPGHERRVKFRAADVGDIEEIVLRNTAENDPWYCEYVRIRSDDGQVASFNVKRWIGAPYDSAVSVTLKPSEHKEGPVQDVDCHTRASDIFDRIPEKAETFRVRCPMNCQASEFSHLLGSSIHPASASICASAVLDGVLSPSGGEVVVTVVGALPHYTGIEDAATKQISESFVPNPTMPSFSFYLYRSDSIDDVDRDVRVVDAYGKLASTGRLEVKKNGVWGSVCSKGDFAVFTLDSARKACQELGYLHGMYLEDGCNNADGQNVCGGRGYPISVAGVMCLGNEKSIADCAFEEPPRQCSDHSHDVAIKCTNNPPAEPPLGTLRIVDVNGAPSLTGVGRLEFYNNGWGSVCDDGWSKESERVACIEMGYSGLKNGGYSDGGCADVDGVNYCGDDKHPINAVDVSCQGDESGLRHCQHETSSDIYCTHDEDVVVGCSGAGDPSGIGLFRKDDLPAVSKMRLQPKTRLNCGDRPMTKSEFMGMPGAMFLATCPAGCSDEPGSLKGTFIYTDDSPICKAAIHAGVVSEAGGDVVVVLGNEQRSFFGSEKHSVTSESSGPYSRSYTVSRPFDDVRAREGKIVAGRHQIFGGKSALRAIGRTLPSFQQLGNGSGDNYIPAKFSWSLGPDFQGFKGKKGDFVDTSSLPGANAIGGFSDFSVAVSVTVRGGARTWRSILAQGDCEGFLLAIDDHDELVFEQNCHPTLLNTGVKPSIGEPINVAVTYYSPEKLVAVYVNGRKVAAENVPSDFNLKNRLIIGRSGETETEYFLGEINDVQVFDYVLTPEQVKALAANVGSTRAAGRISKSTRRTEDGRACMSPCSSEEPLSNGTPEASHPTNPAIRLGCSDTLQNPSFNGSVDSKFLVSCPDGCLTESVPVKGSKIYAPSSSICRAALHSGTVRSEGGEAVVILHNGLRNYPSSRGKNGITSNAEDEPQLRSFSLGPAPKFRRMKCTDDAGFLLKMSVGAKELLICPSGCQGHKEAGVYGTKLYSPLSSPCRAAIHAGFLTNRGGEVEIQAGPEHESFAGSKHHGIVSEKSGSYLRSFSFLRSAQDAKASEL